MNGIQGIDLKRIERDIFREDEIRREERGGGNIRFLGNPLLPPSPLPPLSFLFVCLVFYFAVVLGEKRSRLFNAKCGMHINPI